MIIAIDGPSASGKGVIGKRLADMLGYAYLDTGLLFRALAHKVMIQDIDIQDQAKLIEVAQHIDHEDLDNPELRSEATGKMASTLAVIPELRNVLNAYQRQFGENPPENKKGAVVDGRDIGTVIFPEADCKLFITADVETRALRRHNQLLFLGLDSIFAEVLRDLKERDKRDTERPVAPLLPADDALQIDTTDLSIEHALEKILSFISHKRTYLFPDHMQKAV